MTGRRPRQPRASDRGQVLVLFALTSTALLLMAAVALDVSRFISERRFLQNSADAAALAGAHELTMGGSSADADSAARQVLLTNLAGEPTGNLASLPPTTPVYQDGCSEPTCLVDGIVINGAQVRVALRNDVQFMFGSVVGLGDQSIAAGALAGPAPGGGMVPIAVREFIQPPGPQPGAGSPCPAYNDKKPTFTATFATAATACLGSEASSAGRVGASQSTPGQTVEIIGSGSQSFNAKDFTGVVMLDIRDYASATSRKFYGPVTSGTNDNTLKDVATAYIQTGYTGPPFKPVSSLPHPDWQVAALQGVSTGHWRPDFTSRYEVGDHIIVIVYNGHVYQIPEFFLSEPNQVPLAILGSPGTSSSTVSDNNAFSGSVAMSAVQDPADVTPAAAVTFSPTSVVPKSNTTITATLDPAALPGIYAMWVEGRSSLYSYNVKRVPLSINVGGITSDFTLGPCCELGATTVNAGDPADFTVTVARSGSGPLSGVVLTLENLSGNPISGSITPSTIGSFPTTVSVTVNTGGLSSGLHTFVLRGKATLDDGTTTVTHLLPLHVNVSPSTSPGKNDYVDIKGFALMEVMEINSNSVFSRALTPVLSSMDDEALLLGKPVRLVPWDYSP